MTLGWFKLRLKETLGWKIRDSKGRFIKPIKPEDAELKEVKK